MAKFARIVFSIAVCMLWLAAALLGMEVVSYYAWQKVLRDNAWVRECMETEYLQAPRIRPVPDLDPPLLGFVAPVDSEDANGVTRSMEPSSPFEKQPDRLARYRRFEDISPNLRESHATLNFDAVLDFGPSGNIEKEYGNFTILQLEHLDAFRHDRVFDALGLAAQSELRTAVKRLRDATQSAADLTLELEPDLTATLLKVEGGHSEEPIVRAFIRANEHPAVKPWVPEELPEDTPWSIPFYRYKSNLRQARSIMAESIDTDSFGFRTPQVEIPKPAGIYRILCFGGSTTEEGTLDSSTYPAILQRLLREYTGDNSIEVINAGVCSATTNTHMAATADFLAYEPDLVLAYEGINDVVAYLVLHGPATRSPVQSLMDKSTFLRRNFPALLYPGESVFNRYLETYTFRHLEAMRMLFLNHGADFMLCSLDAPSEEVINSSEREYFDYSLTRLEGACSNFSFWNSLLDQFNSGLKSWCEANGVGYLPVAEHISAGVEVYPDICHMYDEGIELKARIIFELCKDWVMKEALSRKINENGVENVPAVN